MTYAEQASAIRPDHPNGTQALALVTAAVGRAAEAVATAESVDTMVGATYMDRFLAGVALALAHAQLGNGTAALEALDAVDAAIEATDDAAAPVLVRLARAEALRALGDGLGADEALADADRHADLLDMDPQPWQAAFRLVACGDGCRSPADAAT